jgi:CheY-like chemotaxis protein
MSLVGKLEDLSLGDILQIVSLSKRSGILTINSKRGLGRIVFKDGQVIQATSDSFKDNIAQVLVKYGVLGIDEMREVVEIWKKEKVDIKEIIIRRYNIPVDVINNNIRQYIEKAAFDMFNCVDGDFNFEIEGADEEIERIKNKGLEVIYEPGIDPLYLAMEGLRIFDELQRYKDKKEISKSPVSSEGVEVHESLELTFDSPIIIIDRDSSIVKYISEILSRERYKVFSFSSIGTALAKIDELKEIGITPIVIADLFIPRMDGEGPLGGIEMLEIIRTIYPDIPFILMSGEKDKDAETEAKRLNVDLYINKPRVIDSKNMELFTKGLIKGLSNISSEGEELFDIRKELKDELEFDYDDSSNYAAASPILSLLKSMITELNSVNTSNEIILLILRFASELMNRAVIFIVKDKEIAGLGQFGINIKDDIPDKRVRRMRIPLTEESVFLEAINNRSIIKKSLETNKWNKYLINELGGMVPREVFVAPIISEGEVIAFLYGDNIPEDRSIGDTESLEIFLSQAGISMERILLEERIKSLKKKD